MSVREDYLKSSNGKNQGLVKAGISKERENNGDHLFPFSPNVANSLFENAVINAGLMTKDERTKRSQIHLHMTRKFFISQMALLASSKEIPETLAGHGGNMTAAYRRYPVKQLAEEYLKVQHLLTITEEQELKSIETGFKNQLQKHSSVIAESQIEIAELKKQLAETLARVETENKMTNEIFQTIIGDPSMLITLKEMAEIVKQVKENPELLQKMAQVIEHNV